MDEKRYDPAILDEIDQIIYIADMDTHELLFVNRTGRRVLGCGMDYHGKRCFEVLQGLSSVCPFCRNNCLNDNGETCCWDHFNKKTGAYYQLQDRQISFEGHRARIEIAIDFSAREGREQELKNALAEQSMLTSCVRTLNGNNNLDERIHQVLSDLGQYYQADRAYLFRIRRGGRQLDNTYEWCAGGIAPQIQILQGVDIRFIARWNPAFQRGEAVVEQDIEHIRKFYADEYKIMIGQGIRSYMEAPLFYEGKLCGFLGIDNPDASMIGNSSAPILAMAYAISSTLFRDFTNRRLSRAQRRYERVVEGANIGIWEYNIRKHQILNSNRKFSEAGFPALLDNVPESILPYFRKEDRKTLQMLYRRIEQGEERLEGNFWMKWKPDAAFRCEHIAYFVEKDSSGQPEMAYGISFDITAQKREEARYERTLREMTASVPNAVGVLHVNLTKNSCSADTKKENFFGFKEQTGSWDDLIRQISAGIPEQLERDAFQLFTAQNLLSAFHRGKQHIQQDYRFTDSEGKLHFVTTCLQMIQNPDSDEIEGVVYSLDQSGAVIQNEIFRIITDRSFDLVALIHLSSGIFEAVFLGESIPEEYRTLLPARGARCSFKDFCAEAVRHMDAETRADYETRLSPEYMRSALEKNGGTYEFMLKEYFSGKKHGIMYRKFLHYRLDSDPDTILVIESDETEATLHQQEELKRVKSEAERDCLIMDSIMGGITVLRMDEQKHLCVEYFNSYVFQMLGYHAADCPQRAVDAIGTPYEQLFGDALSFIHPDDREYVQKMFLDNGNEKTFTLRPYRMYGKDNRCYWMLERVRTGVSAEGKRIFYAAFHDVTEQIKLQETVTHQLELEKQLRSKADKANAAKSDFLSRMSHDMRTPLNGIIGMTYLTDKMDLPREARENLGKIDTSSKFLLGLVNDILDMSKMENRTIELHPEPYPYKDFCAYLDAVIRPLCDEKKQKFLLDTEPLQKYTPLIDIMRLNRIYFNLLSNAVKYTPEGGTILLRIREILLPGNRIQFTLTVADNGIGMSREFQKHLFEPFVQENRDDNSEMRGSGLGLAIVKKTVEAMGGTISVESEKGKGTRFTISIISTCVRREEVKENKSVPSADEDICLSGRHILLCEDHPLNQEIAKELLEEKGVFVRIAEDGQKGVEEFAGSPVHYFDCILMDLRMPVMNGLEAARTIRGMERPDAETVPILAMTADAFTEDIQKCRQAGMNGHIAKPIDPLNLYQIIQKALRKKEDGTACADHI